MEQFAIVMFWFFLVGAVLNMQMMATDVFPVRLENTLGFVVCRFILKAGLAAWAYSVVYM